MNVDFNVHELAKEMESVGFTGQGMRNPEQAHSYIMLAADNPNIAAELPEAGIGFWKACRFQYRIWQSRKKRGLPILDADANGGAM